MNPVIVRRQKIDPEELGLKALAFLAQDGNAMTGFLATCGADIDTVRARAAEPEFLSFVLDYLLSDETLLLAFARTESLDPHAVARARTSLPGGEVPEWT